MSNERVRIELLQPKIYHRHYRLPKGSIHLAWIQEDGTAQLYKYPSVTVDPRHFKLFLLEKDFDNFLTSLQ